MDVTIVCVPFQMDVARWGYALGPQAFLDAGLVQRIEAQGHTVHAPIWIDLPIAERTRDIVTNLGRIAQRTSDAVNAALARDDGFVLVLEGDCTHAVGAIGGLARALRETPGVVWFDAHGDLHTMATTTSGYVGGMPYAVALGWEFDDWRAAAGLDTPVRPEAAALIGASDLDKAEIVALQRHPIARLDSDQLLDTGAAERVAYLLRQRAAAAPSWYLHLDIDVAGPETSPGGMTPAPYWPPRQRLIESVGAAAHTVPVRVAAIATYNPTGDPAGNGANFGIDAAEAILTRSDVLRSLKTGIVSPLAARLSSVAYVLGFVSVSPYVLFLAALLLGNLHLLAKGQNALFGLLGTVLSILFLIPPLPTTVMAMIALRLMRDVPAFVPQKVRANRAMGMGIIPLSLTLLFLFVKVASGGIL